MNKKKKEIDAGGKKVRVWKAEGKSKNVVLCTQVPLKSTLFKSVTLHLKPV